MHCSCRVHSCPVFGGIQVPTALHCPPPCSCRKVSITYDVTLMLLVTNHVMFTPCMLPKRLGTNHECSRLACFPQKISNQSRHVHVLHASLHYHSAFGDTMSDCFSYRLRPHSKPRNQSKPNQTQPESLSWSLISGFGCSGKGSVTHVAIKASARL